MDQFVDRAELLRRLDREYYRFHKTIEILTPEQLQSPGVVGTWSIKDVVAHFIAHEQFALRELQHALRDERYVQDGYETVPMNNRAVAERQHQSITEVFSAWATSYQQVVTAVRELSDTDFDPAGPVVQALDDSIDGALGNNTYDHYAEHLPEITAWIQRQE